jgi:ABC-type multidrug transport system ATPase subunit
MNVPDLATVESPAPAGPTHPNEVVLRTRGLSKQYGARMAVDQLNLDVNRGEIFGFLGPNGAGKTTTIRMVLGLISPTSGTIEVLGRDLAQYRAQVLPRVGALVEQPALYLYMSGRDNLRAVGSVLGGVPEKRLDEVLDLVQLLGRDRDRVKTYSLGMKQRLGVAMALLQNPELLVLDEPANGLDPAGIVEMRDLMRSLAASGKTVFISSHVLTEVRQICTRVAILNLGKLVTDSTVEALVAGHGHYVVQLDPSQVQVALGLVRQQPWGGNASVNASGALVTAAPGGRGRDLNLFLVNAGIVPDALTPETHDLEQVFLDLTNSANGLNGGSR